MFKYITSFSVAFQKLTLMTIVTHFTVVFQSLRDECFDLTWQWCLQSTVSTIYKSVQIFFTVYVTPLERHS